MSDKVQEVIWLIRTMSSSELATLKIRLNDEFGDLGPDSGVREPRRPRPSTGGAAQVLTEPKDE